MMERLERAIRGQKDSIAEAMMTRPDADDGE